jgi:toxin HigB-1
MRGVIRSFANSATRRFYEGKTVRFGGMDEEAAHLLLAALDEATGLSELSPLASVGLHKLKGDRKGQWAMTINGRWRLCFRFANGDATDVEIVDYHRG